MKLSHITTIAFASAVQLRGGARELWGLPSTSQPTSFSGGTNGIWATAALPSKYTRGSSAASDLPEQCQMFASTEVVSSQSIRSLFGPQSACPFFLCGRQRNLNVGEIPICLQNCPGIETVVDQASFRCFGACAAVHTCSLECDSSIKGMLTYAQCAIATPVPPTPAAAATNDEKRAGLLAKIKQLKEQLRATMKKKQPLKMAQITTKISMLRAKLLRYGKLQPSGSP